MSDDEFHVHGPHEHIQEHGHGDSVQAPGGLGQYVAIFTALLATLGAVVSYQSADTLSEAVMYKNEAVLKKTHAADLWNFYQAKSMKGHLMEIAADLMPPDRQAKYRAEAERYNQNKSDLQAQAESLEKESAADSAASAAALLPHHRQAQAMTLIQIAISVASITALTRQRWLFALAGIAGAGGIGLWMLSMAA